MVNPLFASTSSENPSLLTISFASDPSASLGAQLNNCDKEESSLEHMFLPGYATIGKVLEGDTIARRCDVHVGDVIVAINGQGVRRFAPDYQEGQVVDLTPPDMMIHDDSTTGTNNNKALVLNQKTGENYATVLQTIKDVKAQAATSSSETSSSTTALVLHLERYTWDARPNSWHRFLAARDSRVPDAMQMIQLHEQWREMTFPIDLTNRGLQQVLKSKAVSEIDLGQNHHHTSGGSGDVMDVPPPTVYVNYGKLQSLLTTTTTTTNNNNNNVVVTADDVVKAFVIFTEIMLSRSTDPCHPKTCQLIDLSGVSITTGFRVDVLKQIYAVFEPNYPETLSKMVLYPVSTMVATTARTLLSFVNEKTQKKFVITSSLDTVCKELGWNQDEVEECGGVTEFMHKHEKAGDAMILE